MFARLVVFGDPLSGERTEYRLRVGETVAHALMRLWPGGLDGAWRIYRDAVGVENELPAVELPLHVILKGETYLVVREMGGVVLFGKFLINVGMALLLGKAVEMLTPAQRRKKAERLPTDSPNNFVAGQSNVLRAAGRVPEILGRTRSWPDLLLPPVEVWTKRSQQIDQYFVIGMGSYTVEQAKLGETPMASMSGASPPQVYIPGTLVPPMRCLRTSPEINSVSLITQNEGAIEILDVDFFAATSTMNLPETLSVSVGKYIAIGGTLLNSKVFQIVAVPPPTQTTPPFVYTLGGTAVTDEADTNPTFTILEPRYNLACYILGTWGSVVATLWNLTINPVIGDLLELDSTVSGGSIKWTGIITSVLAYFDGGEWYQDITMNDLDGNPIVFANPGGAQYCTYNEWSTEPAETPPPDPGPETNEPTDWYVVPMANPEQVWIDISFPQGLAQYYNGQRGSMVVQVLAEFRRVGATDPQASRGFLYTQSTTGAMRWTNQVDVATLGLPAGSSYIEVRLTRTTPFQPDTTEYQYIQDTRWERLAGMRTMGAREYPDCTIIGMGLTNSRGATSVGQLSFNAIVTRMLPAWDGSAFSTELYPTDKWADNFVARCMATDGARRTVEQIDMAGIYALQAQLDALEAAPDTGAQGRIGMTLDQMQDIDTELSTVADVVRAVVYRVGRKIYVTRDQATDLTIALINGRTKGPEAETTSTRMSADADNDCVVVTWVDEAEGWKIRELTYPEGALGFNPLRVATPCVNWPQAWRRAAYEWNRLKYRREQIAVDVTEDGRLCRPGDVVNITDDIATLATSAGEVIFVAGLVLTLDRDVTFTGGTHSILLRDVAGIAIDIVPCTAVSGAANKVTLSRAPVVTIKERTESLGTMYAFYADTAPNVRRWLLTGVEASGPIVKLSGTNYTAKVYTGDTATLPERPPLFTEPGELSLPPLPTSTSAVPHV